MWNICVRIVICFKIVLKFEVPDCQWRHCCKQGTAASAVSRCIFCVPKLRLLRGVQGYFVKQACERMDARFEAGGSFLDQACFLFNKPCIQLALLPQPPAQGCKLFSPTTNLSQASKWIKGFVKYLAIFLRSEASSLLQCQLAKHQKLEQLSLQG